MPCSPCRAAYARTGTFWPLIQRRWNTSFSTTECNLTNPTSVTWGGALELKPEAFGKGSTLVHSSNVEIGVKRTAMPEESDAVVIGVNAIA